ncbi:hypothetical protein [Vibrio splendidus]|uniref:hypothetical protein n=1 Tax=Vibrio splendidus TaxID=29497 RepID=UPI0006CA15BC|nr:hypothetical protein [Vibrio splendidus]KPM00669.1 hypothetical protein AN167_06430 [Vibrio splendidus]
MSGIVQRNLHRSIAASIMKVAEETGIPESDLVEIMNDKYEYVPRNNQTEEKKLKKQMELDIAAEKHARESKLKVSKTAVAKTALSREMGTLGREFKAEEEGGSTPAPGKG